MKVTPAEVVRRGLTHRCPSCGTGFDRGDGFFPGPWVLNYAVAVLVFIVPSLVAGTVGAISWTLASALAVFGCTILPLLLYYRSTWSWWLMLFFCFCRNPCRPTEAPSARRKKISLFRQYTCKKMQGLALKLPSGFAIPIYCASFLTNPIPRMNIMTNYSLEFGVVLRAVCPTQTEFEG